jgi:hypothetical protein
MRHTPPDRLRHHRWLPAVVLPPLHTSARKCTPTPPHRAAPMDTQPLRMHTRACSGCRSRPRRRCCMAACRASGARRLPSSPPPRALSLAHMCCACCGVPVCVQCCVAAHRAWWWSGRRACPWRPVWHRSRSHKAPVSAAAAAAIRCAEAHASTGTQQRPAHTCLARRSAASRVSTRQRTDKQLACACSVGACGA